ncbi:MAG: glycogen debranching protein GlgX [Treponema sp.]|jgi:glycogen operon protein|nr:glycogen debranching protein GlgX [Treponema sp.]
MSYVVESGKALPLGASLSGGGVNFSLFSRHAEAVSLLLFENARENSPVAEIPLDNIKNKTGDLWHCQVQNLREGACYLYRVSGPYLPEKGLRFNSNKALLDPYARAVSGLNEWNAASSLGYDPASCDSDLSFSRVDDAAVKPRGVIVKNDFDWQGDNPLNYPLRFSVLYETHVKGLTAHPASGVEHQGTYLGIVEKIPFFKELGVTSLEFLPLQEFNENEFPRRSPKTGKMLANYWGYSTAAFFAPKAAYAFDKTPGGAVNEFKYMVRELHKAGLEVILDIVFNHTAEGNEQGPTLSFRGLDNTIYYMLNSNQRYYQNYSGCGNTLNCNHPVVRSFIIDCLHYWVMEMHVDGFRFDLGSILGRDQNGHLMENPPTLELIAEDPVLRHTKIIAEAWDAGGAYQVGWFPGGRWAEWNDHYRDDIRLYWRMDPNQAQHLATRLSGSSDLYLRDGRKPFHSINFITSHDGFTMRDLVSYNEKHNEDNGEEGRDGSNNNCSNNNGEEGPSKNAGIEAARIKLQKNFIATMMVSLGTPMLLGGDEFGRTQGGNNNAYCQDNEISWYDWSLLDANRGLFRFTKEMIAFRLRHHGFMRPEFYTGRDGSYNAIPDITWFNAKGETPIWEKTGYCIALRMDGSKADIMADKDDNDFFIMFNAGPGSVHFSICDPLAGKRWVRAVDTAMQSPQDILVPGTEKDLDSRHYTVQGRSMVILISRTVRE